MRTVRGSNKRPAGIRVPKQWNSSVQVRVVRGRSTKLALLALVASPESDGAVRGWLKSRRRRVEAEQGKWELRGGLESATHARKKQMQEPRTKNLRSKEARHLGASRRSAARLVTYGTNGCRATSVRADDVRAAKARSGVWVKTNGHVLTWPVLEFCEVRPWKSRTGLRRDGGRCDLENFFFFWTASVYIFLSLTYINRGFL
jgi:hypothetical protein